MPLLALLSLCATRRATLAAAESDLSAEREVESLYGGRVRHFTSTGLQTMLNEVSLAVIDQRGIRVLAD